MSSERSLHLYRAGPDGHHYSLRNSHGRKRRPQRRYCPATDLPGAILTFAEATRPSQVSDDVGKGPRMNKSLGQGR
jgi:hypothetical protein